MSRILTFLLSIALWAGQSLDVTTQTGTWTQGARSDTLPYTAELMVHNVNATGPGNYSFTVQTGGIGFQVQWNGGDGWWVGPATRTIGTPCTISGANFASGPIVIRYQYDPSQGALGKETCEWWYYNTGVRTISTQFYTFTLTNTSPAVVQGAVNGNFQLAFLRVYSTLKGENARMPLPADTNGDLLNFKFEGNLTNDSGSNMTMAGAAYTASPAVLVRSTIKVGTPPAALSWISCNSGASCSVDGSDSYQTGDASTAPDSYLWQQLSGPSAIQWSSRNTATTNISGLTFGSYTISLTATSGSLIQTTTMSFGAVPMDSKGVVVPPTDDAGSIFGPMIAFGKNPVAYATERHFTAVENTYTRYITNGAYDTNPLRSWKTGTIAYDFPTKASVALTNSPGTSGTSLQFANLTAFDTSEFPFMVYTGDSYNSGEIIAICSTSSGTTLVACVGGRNSYGFGAANLTAGNFIKQARIKGTGTSFLTQLCSAGLGMAGRIIYQSSNVTATNGSTALVNNVNWPTETYCENCFITVVGAGLDAVTGRWFGRSAGLATTTMTLDRAYPGTTGTVTVYVISGYIDGVPAMEGDSVDFPKGTGPTPIESEMVHSNYGFCGTNTMASFWGGALAKWGTFSVTGARYTTQNITAVNNVYALNYYDEILGLYSQYYSSGNPKALSAARALGDIWITADDYGSCCGQAMLLGAMVNATIDSRYTTAQWKKIRRFLTGLTWDSTYCQSPKDQRTLLGYQMMWMAAASILDPDGTNRGTWAGKLQGMYDAWSACAGVDYSYKQMVYYGGELTGGTATNGSPTVTFPATFDTTWCGYIGEGVAQVSGNKRTVTKVSGTDWDGPSNRAVVFIGVKSGKPWYANYTGTGSTITLAEDYPFTTGQNVSYWIYNTAPNPFGAGYFPFYIRDTTISNQTLQPTSSYFCRGVSSSQLTLDRNFEGATITGNAGVAPYITAGISSQPVMVGLIATAQVYAEAGARKAGNTTLANNLRTLLKNTVDWLTAQNGTGGWSTAYKGVYYQRGGICDPVPVPLTGGPCGDVAENSRINQTETFLGLSLRYMWNQTAPNQTAGDTIYMATYNRPGDPAVWGITPDAVYPLSIFDFLTPRPFTGNIIGMGFGSSWPAARLGGVNSEALATFSITIEKPAWVNNMLITVTRPNGVAVSGTCSTTTCTVPSSVDLRQGAHNVTIDYRDVGNNVLRTARLIY